MRLFGDAGIRADLRLTDTLRAGDCLVLTYEPALVAVPQENRVG
jgi:hypothetical protein